ncbi:MAG: T9SS type A sorting domain-containing protein [Bacteroidetes bacterium]|nr:T9SS type A sorting domain-containing protein [Bacteroidota bacterium]
MVTSVELINNQIPNDFILKQNYPNPFNPTTNIEYTIPSESFVELKVYDILGKEVAVLVNEQQQAEI